MPSKQPRKHREPYPPAVKAEAIEMAIAVGVPKAAINTGITAGTLYDWLRAEDPAVLAAMIARKRQEAAAQIAVRLSEGLQIVQDAVVAAAASNDPNMARRARELATAVGILSSKMHENGQSSSTGGRFGGQDSHSHLSQNASEAYKAVMDTLAARNPAALAKQTVIEASERDNTPDSN